MKNLTKSQVITSTIAIVVLFILKAIFPAGLNEAEIKFFCLLWGLIALLLLEIFLLPFTSGREKTQLLFFSNIVSITSLGAYLIFQAGIIVNSIVPLSFLSFIFYALLSSVLTLAAAEKFAIKSVAIRILIQSLTIFLAIQFI